MGVSETYHAIAMWDNVGIKGNWAMSYVSATLQGHVCIPVHSHRISLPFDGSREVVWYWQTKTHGYFEYSSETYDHRFLTRYLDDKNMCHMVMI